MNTDKEKLTATFVYEDTKVKIEDILKALEQQHGGRYKATVQMKKDTR